ncbi:MAG TPA: tetratricopeptide repeat protein [Terriglobales bacterium]|nr:tetratricopeptide repeat protein [Terriglobales bacterium]
MECSHCHASNLPTASRCAQCNTPLGAGAVTAVTLPHDGTAEIPPPQSGDETVGIAAPSPGDETVGVAASSDGDATVGVAEGWSRPAAASPVSRSPLLPKSFLGKRYEILDLLGEGGMGAVYKARDRELDRIVALKVIRPELAAHPEVLTRFKQELILARKVTHRNVIRIFDLGEVDGTKFITMDYVEGQDLKAVVKTRGKLPVEEIVHIIKQVCLALEAAHAEGVVHRDLKPQNIMVDHQGRAYVMDFGIARSVEPGGMTQTGMLVGTPEYMSPEQVRGEHVGPRSDIFALGLILYELLTGAMPFDAPTAQAAMFKRTKEPARPAIDVDPNVPRFLSEVVRKCLEIDPQRRYQSTREIVADLDAWTEGTSKVPWSAKLTGFLPSSFSWTKHGVVAAAFLALAVAGIVFRGRFHSQPATQPAGPAVSLAILPFRNSSGDQNLDWLGDSLAQMLSTDVGQSASLRVVPPERISQTVRDLRILPSTLFDPTTVKRLADFSSADTVVWGQYAKFGDQIRIDATVQDFKHSHTAKLTESANEKDVLSAVDHLAAQIRDNLALSRSIIKELQGQSFKPSTTSLPALHDYDQGLELARQGNFLDAQKQFDAAIREDPAFALAYSNLAATYAQLGQEDDAERSSQKAVGLSDKLPAAEKYLILAKHQTILKNYPQAIEAYENLVKASPENADLLFALADLYEKSSQFDKAKDAYTKVLTLDPKRVDGLLAMGRVEIKSGNDQGGLEYLTRAQGMAVQFANDEEKAQILQAMGIAYSDLTKWQDALRSFQDSLAIKRRLGLKKGIADSLETIAQTEEPLGKPDQALKDYNSALDSYRELGDKADSARVLNDLADFYNNHSQYEKALGLYKESLQIQVDLGNVSDQGLVLNSIGNTYLLMARYDDARTYFEQALQLREKLKVPGDIADTVHNLAETSTRLGQYDQALQQYLRALDLRRSVGDTRSAALESAGMGTLFGYQGRYGAALSSEDDALKAFRQTKESGFWLAEILGAHGNALAQVGRGDDAQKSLEEALTVARGLNNQAQEAEILGYEGDNFFYRGDYKSAAPLYDQALQAASHTSDARLTLLAKINLAKLAVRQGRSGAAVSQLRALSQQADTMGLKYLSVQCSVLLGEALTNQKQYALAQRELEGAVTRSEKLGLRALNAQSHFLLGHVLELSGRASDAAPHFAQASQIATSIKEEAKADSIVNRSDLAPIFAHKTA